MAEKQPAPAQPSAASSEEAYWICQGRCAAVRPGVTGKYRGILSVDPVTGDGLSLYWSKDLIEVAIPESTLKEVQADGEIVIVQVRRITKAEADAHVRGPAVAGELIKIEATSTEALEAEIARRKAVAAIAVKNGRN